VIQGSGDLHPRVFDLQDLSDEKLVDVSVLAGSFPWGIWSELPSARQSKSIPSCFVMGVHPVDRAVSHYYRSCYHEPTCPHYQTPFNDLSSQDLVSSLLLASLGSIGDAMCRALANRMVRRSVDGLELPSGLTELEEDMALENLETCVVGLQDDWRNTKKMIAHWFPWIEVETMQMRPMDEAWNMSQVTLRPELRQSIEELNVCDTKLYRKMRDLFAKQLSVVGTEAYL
jgi:hypothetical protein